MGRNRNWFYFPRSRSDLREKRVFVTVEVHEVEGCEVGEPSKEAMKERVCLFNHTEREFVPVGEGEKLFGDNGERLYVVTVVAIVV
jgi:hypothetical protein